MESTLSRIMKENGMTNSNPQIVPIGDQSIDGNRTVNDQESFGILFPTTLVQETLENSAHRKLSLIDRLLGKLKNGKDLKEHYIKLLLAGNGV